MKDFSFREILGLMGKTFPFLVFRFLVYFGITLGFILVTGIGAGIGYGVGSIARSGAAGGMIGGLIGFGLACSFVYLIREYLLYVVKAGHIAVLVEVVDGGAIPSGKGQLTYAQEKVRERFVESSLLFGLDQLIKGILRAFNRTFLSVTSFLPIPGKSGLVKLINKIINLSLTYLDEVILAYLMKTRAENPWASSRTALVLYAQNYLIFLKNAAWLTLFIWSMTFAVFLGVLGPVAVIVGIFPGAAGPLTLILALVLAWGIKQAVIEPIGMTALMQVFFKVTKGQVAHPEWEAKLEAVSTKFNELKQKAQGWNHTHETPQPTEK